MLCLEGCQFCELCMVISHYSQRVQDVQLLGLVLQELLQEFAFNIAHFTELMAILWGSLPLGGMANRQRQSTSINHNWPPVGIVASCSYLRFQFGSLCHFLSKISLIRAITYATIRTWYLCTRSTISFTY